MILMIDNYDSFTFNLVQYLKMLNEEVVVYRNDKIDLDTIEKMNPEMLVLSPGPCTPNEAGISLSVVERFKGKIPILGICLGHQTIAQVFGANVIKAIEPMHGKVREITHDGKGVFKDLESPLAVTRYHSLVVDPESLSDNLIITARTPQGEIMGLRHSNYNIESVQFHPEAILTVGGLKMLENFLQNVRLKNK